MICTGNASFLQLGLFMQSLYYNLQSGRPLQSIEILSKQIFRMLNSELKGFLFV